MQLKQTMAKKKFGWGKNISILSKTYEPNSIKELSAFLNNTKSSLLTRGSGRSYGDTSLSKNIISLSKLNNINYFDKKNGVIEVEAGITIENLLKEIIPHGWFLNVVPGTQFITVGGAISCDVHGKNHHRDGCFSDYCTNIIFIDKHGRLINCSPKEKSGYFNAICGGIGLIGVIVKVRIKLLRIKSNLIIQKIVKEKSIDACLNLLERNKNYKYSVSWVDFLNKNNNNDYNCISYFGNHYNKKKELKFIINKKKKILLLLLKACFSINILKLFNFLKFNLIFFNKNEKLINYKEFFFPLDDILKWNTIYGRKGFLQYQFVISKKKVNKILRKINKLNLKPTLVVLKVLGKENKNFLSFPKKGITFAMDFINTKENIKKLKVLNKQLLLDDGRVYLAKDSVINYKDFRKMYPNWTKIKKYKNKFFSSKQSKRLKFK